MKRLSVLFFCILLFLTCLLFSGSALSETAQRKITVMVYMCGSNLESSYGSASSDIGEMQAANVDPREAGLLVLTGGSNIDTGDFSTETTKVLEIAGGRKRCIQETNTMNMGAQETLTWFIRYCMENRPAERYALILWDHGGGPLEGLCWDENHDMDHLSLSELTGALSSAGLEQKLSWIGFDACLMSSLEIADQLAPYADYMIASQETEPAFGWNYSFLTDAGKDVNGAETGRRIIDAYFEGQENSREILTLACTDLSAVPDVVRSMDPVFLLLSKRLDNNSFRSLSGLRMNSTGFGKAGPEAPETGYDLVDAWGLVSGFDRNEKVDSFLDLLDQAIVYNRSNEKGANGLTIYHPYFNKTGYTDKWKENYQQLAFSEGYQSYVNAFGSMLTGEILFRWMDLIPAPVQLNEDGSYSMEMQLTGEQAENAVSAQMLIIRDTLGNELGDNCVLIASCNADIGDDHVVRATWDGRALYAESGNGKTIGPISYVLTDDGKTNTILGHYILKNDYQMNGQIVLYELDSADTSEYPELLRIRVWDEATQSYSSRMSFSEEPYGILQFWNIHRFFPGVDASQALPAFEQWTNNFNTAVASQLDLPDSWRLHAVALQSGQQVYAVFRILDSQQNAVCSLPAEIPDSSLSVLRPVSGNTDNDLMEADLFCRVNTSENSFGLQIEWMLKNHCGKEAVFSLKNPVINNIRITNGLLYETLQPGEISNTTMTISRNDLAFLNTLDSISGTLEITPEDGEKESIPICFTFSSEDISMIGGNTPALCETEQDGISLKLLDIEEDLDIGWKISVLARNDRAGDFIFSELLLNGIHINARLEGSIPAGMEKVYSVSEQNEFYSNTLELPDAPAGIQLVYLEEYVLQSMGEYELESITILSDYWTDNRTCFELIPEIPIKLAARQRKSEQDMFIPEFFPPEDLPAPDENKIPVLAENNLFRVRLRRLAAGTETISLLLEWTNESDEWLYMRYGKASVNGQEASLSESVHIPPHATVLSEAAVSNATLNEPGTAVKEIRLFIYDDDRESAERAASAVIVPAEPFRMGQKGGVWINGESLTVSTAHTKDADLEKEKNPKPLEEILLVPDSPESFRRIIEVPIDSETEKQIDFCRVAVLRRDTDDYWQIVTLNDVKPDGSGVLCIPHPGLFPTVSGNPEICVMTQLGGLSSDTVTGKLFLGIDMSCRNGSRFSMNPVKWEMERSSGTAIISEYEQDESPYTRQWEISSAAIPSMEIKVIPNDDGLLPFFAECEPRSGLTHGTRPHSLQLNGAPLQLELRPITKEDDLQVMVSVFGKDGSKWSFPLIPYPGE